MKNLIPSSLLIILFSFGSIFSNGNENPGKIIRSTTENIETDTLKDVKKVIAMIDSSGIGFLDKWAAKYNGVCVTFYSFVPGQMYSVNYYSGTNRRIMCGTGGSYFLNEFGIADLCRENIILYFIDEVENGMIRIHGASATQQNPVDLKIFPKSKIKEVFKDSNPFETGENFYRILTKLNLVDASYNKEQGICRFIFKDNRWLYYFPQGYDQAMVKPTLTKDKGKWVNDKWFLFN